MATYALRREQWLPYPKQVVFDFFTRPENLKAIIPPWLRFHILTPDPIEMKMGTTLAYTLRVRGFNIRWLAKIDRWNPPDEFVDIQIEGPYKVWHHTHRFSETEGGSLMEDIVRYELPLGPCGRLVHRLVVARDLSRIFDYRGQRIQEILGRDAGATNNVEPLD